jgi:hypothetical protein
MDFTVFWYQIVDMSKSNNAFATVLGFTVTEKHIVWIVAVIIAFLLLLLLKAITSWIVGGTAKQIALQQLPKESLVDIQPTSGIKPTNKGIKSEKQETSEQLLTDTSERRRTLHDFITPDSIHADVLKQTLNNDYPYISLKPNPIFINSTPTFSPTQASGVVDVATAALNKSSLPKLPNNINIKVAPAEPIQKEQKTVELPKEIQPPLISPPIVATANMPTSTATSAVLPIVPISAPIVTPQTPPITEPQLNTVTQPAVQGPDSTKEDYSPTDPLLP